MKNKILKNSWWSIILLALSISFISCDKDDDTNNGGSNSLVGKWSGQDTDDMDTYTYYWTFYDNGKLLIEDRNDLLDGETVLYSYSNNTLTLFGVPLRITWISSTEISIRDSYGDEHTMRKQ